MIQYTNNTGLTVQQLMGRHPAMVLEYRGFKKGNHSFTDAETGKKRTFARGTITAETEEAMQVQVGIFADDASEIPDPPFVKGDQVVVLCRSVNNVKGVLNINAEMMFPAKSRAAS